MTIRFGPQLFDDNADHEYCHVGTFQELDVCHASPRVGQSVYGQSATGSAWAEVLKDEARVTCPVCQTLIALVKANCLEGDFDKSYSPGAFEEAYAARSTQPLTALLGELLK
jgi:hypothetical protein